MPLKTRQQIRADFAHKGVSVSDWARKRGYSVTVVWAIINDKEDNPKYKCLRGQAHDIAVDLGLKQGTSRPVATRLQLAA
ncbi:DNA-binding protein [Ottowia oryzae]|uniref:DNA-binding protein n=1 Tax=Ottowia oryzae TaxID=2109914 RepID=A0A2S0MB26_9BURK|nr:DNA-binding protein [Ottowia oryzae]AVO33026.1 DNA-binding protein [Ottowia oryzae]